MVELAVIYIFNQVQKVMKMAEYIEKSYFTLDRLLQFFLFRSKMHNPCVISKHFGKKVKNKRDLNTT